MRRIGEYRRQRRVSDVRRSAILQDELGARLDLPEQDAGNMAQGRSRPRHLRDVRWHSASLKNARRLIFNLRKKGRNGVAILAKAHAKLRRPAASPTK